MKEGGATRRPGLRRSINYDEGMSALATISRKSNYRPPRLLRSFPHEGPKDKGLITGAIDWTVDIGLPLVFLLPVRRPHLSRRFLFLEFSKAAFLPSSSQRKLRRSKTINIEFKSRPD